LGELELTHPEGIINKNNNWDGGIPIPPRIALGELELTHPKDIKNKNEPVRAGHLPAYRLILLLHQIKTIRK